MSSEIYQEVDIFVKAIFLGVILCVIYDCFRIFRRIIKRGALLTGIEDIIFFVFSAIVIFCFMYNVNGGVIRLYIFMGAFVGIIAYEEGIGKFVVKYVSLFIKKCFEVLKKCFQPIKILLDKCKNKKRGALSAKKRKKKSEKGSE